MKPSVVSSSASWVSSPPIDHSAVGANAASGSVANAAPRLRGVNAARPRIHNVARVDAMPSARTIVTASRPVGRSAAVSKTHSRFE